jgi:3-oxoacyl-[acyl-carrier protein] reductase
MDLELSGKVAVVLASSSGLGLGTARALLAEGACVALSGRDRARLERVERELRAAHGERVLAEPLDVTDRAALERHVSAVRERWGGVHALVTNAGGPRAATALEIDDAGLDEAYELTLRSAIHAVQLVLPGMRAQRYGRIVGLTSLAVRQPIPNLAYSNIMRSGLTAYLKSLAGEVARDGVLVNSLCTGLFATERLDELFELRAEQSGRSVAEERALAESTIPARRLGTTQEFGAFVAFLCSPRSSYLNGVALTLDGGLNGALL